MRLVTRIATAASGLVFAYGSFAMAAPVLDGSGFGAPSAVVSYDPTAPTSNFGSPGPTTSGAAYDVYTRSDSTYAYVLVSESGLGGSSPGTFANFYFGTGATSMSGSDVGFEVTNQDVFSPGSAPSTSTSGTGIVDAVLNGGSAIEFAVPFTYFETDPQGIGFSTTSAANPNIVLRLSQSFGYSVAGGTSYGPDRLGLIVDPIGSATSVPEPASLALLGVGLFGLAFVYRRRRA